MTISETPSGMLTLFNGAFLLCAVLVVAFVIAAGLAFLRDKTRTKHLIEASHILPSLTDNGAGAYKRAG